MYTRSLIYRKYEVHMRSEDATRTKMGATYIKYKTDAGHQHLKPEEREKEFLEEENYMADSDDLSGTDQYVRTRKIEIRQKNREKPQDLLARSIESLQNSEKELQDLWKRKLKIRQKNEHKFDQICQDLLTPIHERLQKIDDILEDIRRREQDIQRRERRLQYIRTREQEIIQRREKILEDIRTPMQERLQKSKDRTTKTTNSGHPTITSLLLGYVFSASRFCSVGAEFIPVESVLSLCKTDLSKLTDTCDHDEVKAIHCVLNDEGELGIGCFSKIWVKQGYCPYFRNYFGVLDIRPCLGNGSICPTDQYLSNEVYKYPGCLINNSTRVLDILTNQTTESTTIRSSDAGDKEAMLLILVMILGLITVSLLLIHGLRFLRPMKINLRGLRSAYAPASMGQQDPQRDGLPDDRVDV